MSDLTVWQQTKDNLKICNTQLGKVGITNKNVKCAIMANFAHESYCNPQVLEGAINPGPPTGGNGYGPAGGLGQWTPWEGKIKLGDWVQQLQFLKANDPAQWFPGSGWFAPAGLEDPTPGLSWDDFLSNAKNYDAAALTKAWLGHWERPSYSAGAVRYASAASDAAEIMPYVDGSGDTGGGGGEGGGNPPGGSGGLSDLAKQAIEDALKEIKKALSFDLHDLDERDGYFKQNSILVSQRTFNNTIHVHLKDEWINSMLNRLGAPHPNGKPSGGGGGGGNDPDWFKKVEDVFNADVKANTLYSMTYRQQGLGVKYSDCSAFVTSGLNNAFGSHYSGLSTATMDGMLTQLGFKKVALGLSQCQNYKTKTGDVFVGGPAGGAGHTFFISDDNGKVMECSGYNGVVEYGTSNGKTAMQNGLNHMPAYITTCAQQGYIDPPYAIWRKS